MSNMRNEREAHGQLLASAASEPPPSWLYDEAEEAEREHLALEETARRALRWVGVALVVFWVGVGLLVRGCAS